MLETYLIIGIGVWFSIGLPMQLITLPRKKDLTFWLIGAGELVYFVCCWPIALYKQQIRYEAIKAAAALKNRRSTDRPTQDREAA